MRPLMLGLALVLCGCATGTIYRSVDADQLHGRSVLLLPPARLPPTDKVLHDDIAARIDEAIARSPQIGAVMTRKDVSQRSDLSIAIRGDYEQFSNTLSLTGMADPDISYRLNRDLGVELLSMAQIAYLPCAICEEGDQLWLVGQIIEAQTGRLLFRAHLRITVSGRDPAVLAREGAQLADDYMETLEDAFRLKWHRLRFAHLKPTPQS